MGSNKLVFSSTAAVYGEAKSILIQENADLAPTNTYGESKLMVEQMLTWFNRIHGLRYAPCAISTLLELCLIEARPMNPRPILFLSSSTLRSAAAKNLHLRRRLSDARRGLMMTPGTFMRLHRT